MVANGRNLLLVSALLVTLFLGGAAGCSGHSSHSATARSTLSVAVDSNDTHACVLLSKGDIYCWGDNESGELGTRLPRGQQDSEKPINVKQIPKAASVAVGSGYASGFTCAALRGGAVTCWGSNAMGTLGRGRFPKHGLFPSGVSGFHPNPTTVRGVERVTAVSGTYSDVCALLSSGRVMCWGGNEYGQLGDGRFNHGTFVVGASDVQMDFSARPVAVKGIHTVTQISAGEEETCAILRSGRVSCWGAVGNWLRPRIGSSARPVEVKGIRGARQVSVGWGFGCAVIAGGSVECWGSDMNDQLAIHSTNGSPVTVRGVVGATQVSAGVTSACAVIRSGSVECWNQDSYWTGKAAPVKGISNVVQVSLGGGDRCAVRSDGTVWCWAGPLGFGPGGLGSTARSKVPTEVTGLP